MTVFKDQGTRYQPELLGWSNQRHSGAHTCLTLSLRVPLADPLCLSVYLTLSLGVLQPSSNPDLTSALDLSVPSLPLTSSLYQTLRLPVSHSHSHSQLPGLSALSFSQL